jgi:hypothetical protein
MTDRMSREEQLDELKDRLDKSGNVVPDHPGAAADRQAYEEGIRKKIAELEGALLDNGEDS